MNKAEAAAEGAEEFVEVPKRETRRNSCRYSKENPIRKSKQPELTGSLNKSELRNEIIKDLSERKVKNDVIFRSRGSRASIQKMLEADNFDR